MSEKMLERRIGRSPLGHPAHRSVESYELELRERESIEVRLRKALDQDEARIRQMDDLIEQQTTLILEVDHRLANCLQILVGMLTMQSRLMTNVAISVHLMDAANRIAMIARIHQRLYSLHGVITVPFKDYLEDFSRDFSALSGGKNCPEHDIVVEAIELELPTTIAIPLSLITNELVTNATKYGQGRIMVRLEAGSEGGYALSVSNHRGALPQEFDPAASKGLGMRITRCLVKRLDGELQIFRGDQNRGARFTVLFS
jgi:two-component sensor histidine kinase